MLVIDGIHYLFTYTFTEKIRMYDKIVRFERFFLAFLINIQFFNKICL